MPPGRPSGLAFPDGGDLSNGYRHGCADGG